AFGSEGEAAKPDWSSAGRQPRGLLQDRVPPGSQRLGGNVPEPLGTPRNGLVRNPQPGKRKPTVGLLPPEPAVRGKPRGEHHGAGIRKIDLRGDANESAFFAAESAIDRRSKATIK